MALKIFTFADKRPDFIPLQYASLKHFLTDDFEYKVFNNAESHINSFNVRRLCRKHKLKCIFVEEQDHSEPTIACARPLQWAYDNILRNESDPIAVIDSDMFLIEKFSIENYLAGYDVAATKQRRGHVTYLWNGIMFFNMSSLPEKHSLNFMFGAVEGQKTDVGGFLYYWMKRNQQLKIRNIDHTSHIYSGNNNLHCLPQEIAEKYDEDFRFEIYERAFLHYGRGSNWDNMVVDYHKRKTYLLKYWVESSISGEIRIPKYDYKFEI